MNSVLSGGYGNSLNTTNLRNMSQGEIESRNATGGIRLDHLQTLSLMTDKERLQLARKLLSFFFFSKLVLCFFLTSLSRSRSMQLYIKNSVGLFILSAFTFAALLVFT
jgi:hypothetical protein